VHDEFKGLELELMRREHPEARVLVHPESPASVVAQADVVGSTSQLLKAVVEGTAPTYIVATDNGILHRMRQLAPGKTLMEAPTAGQSATCKSCAHCPWMAMNELQGVLDCLLHAHGEIDVPAPVRGQALGCIERMLDFVATHPAAMATATQGFVPKIGSA
jgi:quinolinate synthase